MLKRYVDRLAQSSARAFPRVMARRIAAGAAIALAAAFAAGCGSAQGESTQEEASTPSATPPAAAEAQEPPKPRRRLERPLPDGKVELADGSLDPRVLLVELELVEGRRPRATGAIVNLTGTGELAALTVRADFYDERGRLVGSGEASENDLGPFDVRPLRFQVRADDRAPDATSAVLHVLELVIE